MRPATLLLLTFLLTTAIAACGRHAIKSPVEVAPPPPPPEKTGPLDSDEMRTTIEANLAKLNACHDAAKTHKREKVGQIDLAFTIDGSGMVLSARVVKSTVNSTRIEGCVVREIFKIRFRGGGTTVNGTFPLQIRHE